MFGLVHPNTPRGLLEADRGMRYLVTKLLHRTFENINRWCRIPRKDHDPFIPGLTDPGSAGAGEAQGLHRLRKQQGGGDTRGEPLCVKIPRALHLRQARSASKRESDGRKQQAHNNIAGQMAGRSGDKHEACI